MQKTPITYTGTNTKDLYVLALKNGKEVKLKVREINCHSGIVVNPISEISEPFESWSDFESALNAEKLIENTVYTVQEGTVILRYLYFEGEVLPLSKGSTGVAGIHFGDSYPTYQALYENIPNLAENTIYSVTDKGTVEQYIFRNAKLIQLSNGINDIIEDPEDKKSEISDEAEILDGIIDYNMPELVNGNYRYKNHPELHTVISDMPQMETAIQMFYGTSVEAFCGNLSSLKDARGMFGRGCRLDEASIINVIDSIPDWSSSPNKPHRITISYQSSVTEELRESFDIEANNKGWEIEWIAYKA